MNVCQVEYVTSICHVHQVRHWATGAEALVRLSIPAYPTWSIKVAFIPGGLTDRKILWTVEVKVIKVWRQIVWYLPL
jgi:hypothetical protein